MRVARSQGKLNIVYLGMMGLFSRLPLEILLAYGHTVSAIVVPALDAPYLSRTPSFKLRESALPPVASAKRHRTLPQLAPPSLSNIRQIARARGIPLLEERNLRSTEILESITAYKPDAICVACFSQRLPAQLLRIPPLGCINIHPSLLPENRGPDPLFWTFRRGDLVTGVTVHLMDERFDSGPLLAQEPMAVPDGVSERALETQLAARGGELLAHILAKLAGDRVVPIAQDDAQATYYSVPGPKDWIITPDRSARWAYNFALGVGARPVPILIQVPTQTFELVAPMGFEDRGSLPQSWRFDGTTLELSCSPGVFRGRAIPLASAE